MKVYVVMRKYHGDLFLDMVFADEESAKEYCTKCAGEANYYERQVFYNMKNMRYNND